ncbi:hypothetical protein VCRA2113O361_130126 [Vibrio crassostreae]|nr:hypothetical protein VCRA2113O361_130126 [Vibrio crassostreae]CAK2402247.1 hypothetical protein VCRA2113O364_120023 [Vibrio crassostreae]CAK3133386.1 hypothetical protein VCRA2127O399_130023 [Vibrio crassostreae]
MLAAFRILAKPGLTCRIRALVERCKLSCVSFKNSILFQVLFLDFNRDQATIFYAKLCT